MGCGEELSQTNQDQSQSRYKVEWRELENWLSKVMKWRVVIKQFILIIKGILKFLRVRINVVNLKTFHILVSIRSMVLVGTFWEVGEIFYGHHIQGICLWQPFFFFLSRWFPSIFCCKLCELVQTLTTTWLVHSLNNPPQSFHFPIIKSPTYPKYPHIIKFSLKSYLV